MVFTFLLKALRRNPTNNKRKSLAIFLSKITVLDLSNKHLNAMDIKNLCFALYDNLQPKKKLKTLNLSGNAFAENILHTGVMIDLVKALENCPNLKHLNLANNHIGDEGIKLLISQLSRGSTLDCLQLENNDLSTLSFAALYNIIANCETRIFPTTFLGPFFKAIDNEIPWYFKVNREKVKSKVIRDPVLVLLRAMKDKPTPEQSYGLIDLLRNITHLDLSFQKLTADQLCHLAKALAFNSSITVLNLAGNQFGDLDESGKMTHKHKMGILSLSAMIESNHFLTSLNLSDNQINNQDLYFLGRALKKNATLTSFDINRNIFTGEGLWNLLFIIANSTHYIFPQSFLASLLFEQCLEVRVLYARKIYAKNEASVKAYKKIQIQRAQEESGSPQMEVSDAVGDRAMKVGQTPAILMARENRALTSSLPSNNAIVETSTIVKNKGYSHDRNEPRFYSRKHK